MDKKLTKGTFTISLDFELHWGVSEHRTLENYGENLKNVPNVVLKLLESFEKNNIHATWATVGMLFCKNKTEIDSCVQRDHRPDYENPNLSNYRLLETIGQDVNDDPYHFALPLINKIKKVPGQEIGTHTYSHYYCLEKGQTLNNFKEDIKAARIISEKNDSDFSSIVFPRNQYSDKHLEVVAENGIKTFRGNENHWMYQPRSRADETKFRKLSRLIDSYVKISGDNTHDISNDNLVNIPASRFLRPYNPKVAVFDGIRLKRIKNEMTYAAKNNRLYHLWWHPHNFGMYLNENMTFLKKILDHLSILNNQYNFQSLNMQEIGARIKEYG